jgi:hypothetical protein
MLKVSFVRAAISRCGARQICTARAYEMLFFLAGARPLLAAAIAIQISLSAGIEAKEILSPL